MKPAALAASIAEITLVVIPSAEAETAAIPIITLFEPSLEPSKTLEEVSNIKTCVLPEVSFKVKFSEGLWVQLTTAERYVKLQLSTASLCPISSFIQPNHHSQPQGIKPIGSNQFRRLETNILDSCNQY